MKQLAIVVLLTFIFSFAVCGDFNVMTFNVWKLKNKKKSDVLKIIQKSKADIIIFNEADDSYAFEWIANKLKFQSYLGKYKHSYVGIMSRYKISDITVFTNKELRNRLVQCNIQLPNNKKIIVFGLHLPASSYKSKRKKRAREIRMIMSEINKYKTKYPVIVAGDFNELSHLDKKSDKLYVSNYMLKSDFFDTYRLYNSNLKDNPGITFSPTWVKFKKRIDYIYVNRKFYILNSKVLDRSFYKRWPSDHNAVITTLRIIDDR